MVKTKHNIIAIGILGIALAIVIVVVGGISWHHASTPVTQTQTAGNTTSTPIETASSTLAAKTSTPHPPHGAVTYQIAQAATQLPGFVQATIDPVDVSVGQVQHFTIVTDDPNPIVSVVAQITTDHKTITVPLTSQGAPAVSILVPRTIAVGADNRLALISPDQAIANLAAAAANIEAGAHIANAATENKTKFTGKWTVEDTHTAKYQTVFIAKDSVGNTNAVTLDWTDPCPFASTNNYGGGTTTVSGNCDMPNTSGFSNVDGPEHGILAVSGGTLTIDPGATLVINNGYSISFSGGTIAVSGQIVLNQDMCGTDNDGDGYIAGSNWTTSCSGKVSRVNVGGTIGDCDDSDANVHPGQTGWFTSISKGGTWDYNCNGAVTKGYTVVGSITSVGGCNCVAPVLTEGWSSSVPACGVTAGVIDADGVKSCGLQGVNDCNTAENGVHTKTQSCQ